MYLLLFFLLLLFPASVNASDGFSAFGVGFSLVLVSLLFYVLLFKKHNFPSSKMSLLLTGLFLFYFFGFLFLGDSINFILIILVILLLISKVNVSAVINGVDFSKPVICSKCGLENKVGNKFCTNCGANLSLDGYNSNSLVETPTYQNVEPNKYCTLDQDAYYSEEELLNIFIDNRFKNNPLYNDKFTCKEVESRKYLLFGLFCLINIVFIGFIFFHMQWYYYLIEVLNIVIYFAYRNKYTYKSYIIKEIKNRPDEPMSNVIDSIIARSYIAKHGYVKVILTFASFILPLLFFINPHMIFEPYEDGYYVRFYSFGLTNMRSVDIPTTHNDKKVYGIRGDVFSNMPFLEEVNIEEGIEVIRGQAFKNDKSLTSIELPSTLTYLGGSAFANCTNLESINLEDTKIEEINGDTFKKTKISEVVLPNTVRRIGGGAFAFSKLVSITLNEDLKEIGGGAFADCYKLKNINLEDTKIVEVRGETFQNCYSLDNVIIPEGVTRIGGHAFHSCVALSNIYVPQTVKEIGSSAFRSCSSLNNITIPRTASREQNSFKESPTIISYDYYTGGDMGDEWTIQ